MNKWLITEAALVTLVPTCMAIYAIPVFVFTTIETIFPIASDTRTFSERILALLPYVGGIFAIFVIWRLTFAVASNRHMPITFGFFAAVAGGAFATWEIVRTSNLVTGSIVCLPIWLLLGQLSILNHLKRRSGTFH